jgi:hypothetical protein
MSTGDTIEIDTGSGIETRKIVNIGTAATNATTLWQPLPDGPVITIPVGSTNVPVTSVAGVEVGQKIGIGYGATYPTVAKAMEKYEVVTVTAVGKQGTQAWLTAPAKVGETNIKVSSVNNISAGDKIRLDIDSVGHGIETVTVAHVGTASVRNAFGGPLRDADLGTGLDLAEPLKFNHSYNISFSARGTGINFQPKTSFAHSSNEPLQPLGTGITLDKPLASDHAINAVVRDATVTSAGYQGIPDQWFGGPAFANAGNMVLRDSDGLVVDSLNYGGVIDPWAAEGYQGTSPGNGCSVSSPRGGAPGARGGNPTARSAGRFPDGVDTDSNCDDFHLQPTTTLMTYSDAGANNIKVSSADFNAGQKIFIGMGANRETAVIATVGTPGGTTVRTATDAGVTAIPVVGILGFTVGQTVTIDSGTNQETAVVASVTGARGRGAGRGPGGASISVSAPLTMAHAADVQVSGSGITFTAGLTKTHDSGTQVIGDVPTPGEANRYFRRTQ